MNIKQQIIEAYKAYETKYGSAPKEVEVIVKFNTTSEEKQVTMWIGDNVPNDGDFFHVCISIHYLLELCGNGNGQQFMVTGFVKFVERPTMTGFAFIAGKIRELQITELKVHVHSSLADSNGGEVDVDRIAFKAAGIDKDFRYSKSNPKASNLPKNLRIFKKPETLTEALEEGGDWLFQKFYDWDDEYIPELCPLIKSEDRMFYRSTDIAQEFFDNLPETMFYEEDDQGVTTVCSWRWNGFKPVHEAVCEDDNDLIYDVLAMEFNLNMAKDVTWYANADLCREDNKIEIVRF